MESVAAETDREHVLRIASGPMADMRRSIIMLRVLGHAELADELLRIRDAWAKAAAKR